MIRVAGAQHLMNIYLGASTINTRMKFIGKGERDI